MFPCRAHITKKIAQWGCATVTVLKPLGSGQLSYTARCISDGFQVHSPEPFMAIYFLLFCNLQSSIAMRMQIWGFQSTGTHSSTGTNSIWDTVLLCKHQTPGQAWDQMTGEGLRRRDMTIMGWSWTWKRAWSLPSIILFLLLSKKKRKARGKEVSHIKKHNPA